MTCTDLKDVYLSVHVHKSSHKYMCFQWKNMCHAFQGLPFGPNTAPRVFTKLVKLIADYLRKRDIRIIVYQDDFLILGSSIEESKATTQLTLDLLQWLRFTTNWENFVLVFTDISGPLHRFTHNVAQTPREKEPKHTDQTSSFIRNPTPSTREVASPIGRPPYTTDHYKYSS